MTVTDRTRRVMTATVAVVALSALATVVVPGTFGFFNRTTINPGNAVTSGTVTMSNSDAGSSAILAASTFKPGGIACAQVTVTNSGGLPAQVELSESNVTGGGTGKLGRSLQLAIVKDATTYNSGTCATTGGTSVFSGAFDSFTPNPSRIAGTASAGTGTASGDWLKSEAHVLTFVVSFPAAGLVPPSPGATPGPTAGDSAFQGVTASAEFDWYSAQSTVSVVSHT